MTRTEIFATLKEANAICDKMDGLNTNSPAYADLSEGLYWLLDSLTMGLKRQRNMSLHLSKRTGHYYIKIA